MLCDNDDDKIGEVGDAHTDSASGEPEWLAVKTGWAAPTRATRRGSIRAVCIAARRERWGHSLTAAESGSMRRGAALSGEPLSVSQAGAAQAWRWALTAAVYADGIDAADVVWTSLPEYVLSPRPAREVIKSVIDVCEPGAPHAAWRALRVLAWDEGVTRVEEWLADVLRRDPPPQGVRGLWFGLNNPVDGSGRERSDLYLAGTQEHDPDDENLQWVFSGVYYPESQPAPDCLAEMYRIAYGPDDGLGNDAEWPLALVFGCVAAARALDAVSRRLTGWRAGGPARRRASSAALTAATLSFLASCAQTASEPPPASVDRRA